MEKNQSLLEFFAAQNAEIGIVGFLINFLLAAVLSFILSRIYIRFGNSLSNREIFGRNFVLLSMTTMLIITIVKSSLALSLGLVGALSIIRFRAAIKEPEELSYLFLAIAIGLGMGANQPLITIIAFAVMAVVLAARKFVRDKEPEANLYVTISGIRSDELALPRVLEVIGGHAHNVRLRRFDETEKLVEVSFQAQFQTANKVNTCVRRLRDLHEGMKISLVDDRGISA
ncbi:MAG: hypothetical protein M2R45_04111 [Verrucomicrobia subdivision 3 bacterium]|nr:hypothetical protein [Limisphaerales bacterium]MCS1417088.1 hypothetical protein [Limisphaerales bacterium]